jgi:hypothetical protein
MNPRIQRLCLIVAATIVAAYVSVPAPALNGNVYVASCACKTTSDFTTVATDTAIQTRTTGTFRMVSTSVAESAYMQVQGHLIVNGEHESMDVTSVTPVDASGNSLAGNSESELEAYYVALDQAVNGTSRSFPLVVKYTGVVGLPLFFGTSTDAQITKAFQNTLAQDPASELMESETGQFMLVQFYDGTWAGFEIDWSTGKIVLTWNGYAYQNGNLVNRQGVAYGNRNTSGTGGGNITVPGFDSGGNFQWNIFGGSDCIMSTTISVDGDDLGSLVNISPC